MCFKKEKEEKKVTEKELYKWLPEEIRDQVVNVMRTKSQARALVNTIRALISAYDFGKCLSYLDFRSYALI